VQNLYTYPCTGTGGHPEYAKIYNDTWHIESEPWRSYQEDGNNIYFNHSFTLVANETYNYTIRTGSYPQIHHAPALRTDNGWLNRQSSRMPTARSIRTGYPLSCYFDNAFIANKKVAASHLTTLFAYCYPM